jgi:chloramphenicol 3-O-phosphotransferase
MFSIGTRRSRLIAYGLEHTDRDPGRLDSRTTDRHSNRHAGIHYDTKTERDPETTGDECARRIARHRSPCR